MGWVLLFTVYQVAHGAVRCVCPCSPQLDLQCGPWFCSVVHGLCWAVAVLCVLQQYRRALDLLPGHPVITNNVIKMQQAVAANAQASSLHP